MELTKSTPNQNSRKKRNRQWSHHIPNSNCKETPCEHSKQWPQQNQTVNVYNTAPPQCRNNTQYIEVLRGGAWFLHVHVTGENEWEQELVLLKQWAAHVTVQAVREVVRQITQATIQNLGFVAAKLGTANGKSKRIYRFVHVARCRR